MSKELERPNKEDYYDLLGGFMPVIWDRDVKEYIDQIEAKLQEAEERIRRTESHYIKTINEGKTIHISKT